MGLRTVQPEGGGRPQALRSCALATVEGVARCVVGTTGWRGCRMTREVVKLADSSQASVAPPVEMASPSPGT